MKIKFFVISDLSDEREVRRVNEEVNDYLNDHRVHGGASVKTKPTSTGGAIITVEKY